MAEDRIFPCYINGKYYLEEVDFDELVKKQTNRIVKNLELQLTHPDSKFYGDEKWKNYIQEVKNGNIQEILNPPNNVFRDVFDIAVLNFGSYEFVKKFLSGSNLKSLSEYLQELDDMIVTIQNSISEYCMNKDEKTNMERMQNLYCNFLENFAPQRLLDYTKTPIQFDMIYSMCELKKQATENLENHKITKKLIEFDKRYHLDDIMKVLDLYQNLGKEKDKMQQKNIADKIDSITVKGISNYGNNNALIQLSLPLPCNTMNQIIDGIAIRAGKYNYSENLDIAYDFQIFLNKFSTYIQTCPKEELYTLNITLHKLLKLADLEILPTKEQRQLIDFLENQSGRKEIGKIDMSKFDDKIARNETFSKKEVKEFFENVMKLTVKEANMPVPYNEFFIAKLIEDNHTFCEQLSNIQKEIILEYFASIKSKQLIGKKNYITFSNDFEADEEKGIAYGTHQPGFVKLRHFFVKNQSISTVLYIITIFHELRHEKQKQNSDSQKYDHLTYINLKEDVLELEDKNYYDKNYFSIYSELDANYFALNMTLNFLNTLPLDEKFRNSNRCNEILKIIDKKLENVGSSFTNNREFKNEKMIDFEDAFDSVILEHKEILDLKPIFKVEYHKDGTRKSVKQIFEDFIDIIRVKENRLENYDLYKYILFSRAGKEIDECREVANIDIPENLTPSTRKVLELLKTTLLENKINPKTFSSEIGDDFQKVCQKDGIDKESEEMMTSKELQKYDEIFGSRE